MAPSEHLDWLEDNTRWFDGLEANVLDTPVPSCPGWSVEKVVTHLCFGLGLAYPAALNADPDSEADQVWSTVSWPTELPTGPEALHAFTSTMDRCLQTFRSTEPIQPCWTYDGPGTAAFWFRRAAIETTLHRMDVVEALGRVPEPLATDRAIDAITETVEFALPLAASLVDEPTRPGSLNIVLVDTGHALRVGDGPTAAEMRGAGDDVLAALWGRHLDRVAITGDETVAGSWLTAIERAFAGR